MRPHSDVTIGILRCEYRENIDEWDSDNVFNPWWYCYWNFEGDSVVALENREHRLAANEFFLISPETPFATRGESRFSQFYIHFTAGTPFRRINSKIYRFPSEGELVARFRDIRKLLDARVANPVAVNLLAHAIVCQLLANIDPSEHKHAERVDPRIKAALIALEETTSELIPNETLAENVGMSVNGFIRLFAKEVGVTPQKHSRLKRIEKACVLLRFGDQTIEEIANATGFLDRYHFSRSFKEITGHSPAKFRNGL